MAELIGQTIGNYRVEELLGTGGMGQVFRGVHIHLGRPAAIKVMHEHLAVDPGFQARFLQEARAAANLTHPHIVQIYDFGSQDGQFFLVMELVADGSLRSLIGWRGAAQPVDLPVGLELARQSADGLGFAHRLGMVHRDVKPENLLLKAVSVPGPGALPQTVKVGDFGLARLADSQTLTLSGVMLGTPAYMSPEQCQGLNVDPRSDIYSLGVVLYEVVTGVRPFEVKTPTEAIYKHVFVEPPPPRQVRGDLPPDIEAVILRCMAKRPDDRFANGAELAADLERLLEGLTPAAGALPVVPPHEQLGTPPDDVRPQAVEPITPIAGIAAAPLADSIPSGAAGATITSEPVPPVPVPIATPTPVAAPLALRLDPGAVTLQPGRATTIEATLATPGAGDRYELSMSGIPAAWVELPDAIVATSPDRPARVQIRLSPPDTSIESPAASIATVTARSLTRPDSAAQATFAYRLAETRRPVGLAAAAISAAPGAISLAPETARGGTGATYRATIRNDGAAPTTFAIVPSPAGTIAITPGQSDVSLAAGDAAEVPITVTAPRRWLGAARQHPVGVTLTTGGSPAAPPATATFVQTALLPVWAAALLLVALIAGIIGAFTLLGGSDGGAAPTIASVTLDPENPAAGEPVTVSWDVSNATRIDIQPLVEGLNPDDGAYTFADGFDDGTTLTFVAANDDGEREEPIEIALAAAEPTATPTGASAAPTATLAVTATAPGDPTATPTQSAPVTRVINTPTPRPTIQIVLPTPEAGSDLVTLVSDNFDSADNTAFYIGETQFGTVAGVADGWYTVTVPESGWQVLTAGGTADLADGAIVADVKIEGDGVAGVAGRSVENDDGTFTFYLCWINSRGNAGCHSRVNDQWTELFSRGEGSLQLQEVNRLVMTMVGTSLYFEANDQEIGLVDDSASPAGEWGVYGESLTGTTTLRFDAVVIAQVTGS
jgi:serine/threonine protein kinase